MMNKKIYVCWNKLKLAIGCQKGQGMVEYGLILALVSVVAIGGLTLIGGKLGPMFNSIAGNIK